MIRTILLDDERIILNGMKKIIRENLGKFQIVGEFQNGQECVQYLLDHSADLIISDIRMPFMDGLELMEIVREKNVNVDFLFISGYDDFEYCRKALQGKAIDYLLKPIDKKEFISILQKYAKNNGKITGSEDSEDEKRIVKEIKSFLKSQYNKEISLRQLGEKFYLNPVYVSQFFKKETGMTITEYVTNIRMEMACIYLKKKEFRVGEIAQMVGYDSPKQFAAMFKKRFGVTPKQYRDSKETVDSGDGKDDIV